METSSHGRNRRSISLVRLAVALLFLGSINSCTTPYRSYAKERSHTPHVKDDVPIAVIEFDERGDYWEPKQNLEAGELIRSKNAPVLITYVHGWRHDARPDDRDMQSFQDFLNAIKRTLPGAPVCGVFIGWRGASVQEHGLAGALSLPSAIASFWGRKKITDQMAGVPLSNTLWKLASLAREKGGHSILIGHSFGGRIVEHTLGPAAVSQMNNQKPMPYDLTFLINPATESLYARQLKFALAGWQAPRPAIVVLTAKDDGPNKVAWPLAMHLPDGIHDRKYAVDLPAGQTEDQRSYVTCTIGNDPRQLTHTISMGEPQNVQAGTPLAKQNLNPTDTTFVVRLSGKSADGHDRAARCHLERAAPTAEIPFSPAYWVVSLDKEILSKHGGCDEDGIFSRSMTDLMAGIAGQVGVVQHSAPVAPRANPGATEKPGVAPSSLELPGVALPF